MTPATSSSAPSPNGETDMNDIKADPTPQPGFAHDFDCTYNPCRCWETDMNDIDTEEGRRYWSDAEQDRLEGSDVANISAAIWSAWAHNNAAAMFDAIETGRRWETIARQALPYTTHRGGCAAWLDPDNKCDCGFPAWRAAFRDVTDRTPGPTDGVS